MMPQPITSLPTGNSSSLMQRTWWLGGVTSALMPHRKKRKDTCDAQHVLWKAPDGQAPSKASDSMHMARRVTRGPRIGRLHTPVDVPQAIKPHVNYGRSCLHSVAPHHVQRGNAPAVACSYWAALGTAASSTSRLMVW